MPIEIKELHIRVTVNASPSGRRTEARGGAGTDNENERDQIVAECVEQVLEILERKQER
ncbi:MAG: DUF5908 family protein [Nitrospira sp.]